jgi:hypothetical protein
MTRRAEQRVASAESRAAKEQTDVDRLEADMSEAVAKIADDWGEKAAHIETIEIGLEKTDVQVEPPVLVWVPVGSWFVVRGS